MSEEAQEIGKHLDTLMVYNPLKFRFALLVTDSEYSAGFKSIQLGMNRYLSPMSNIESPADN